MSDFATGNNAIAKFAKVYNKSNTLAKIDPPPKYNIFIRYNNLGLESAGTLLREYNYTTPVTRRKKLPTPQKMVKRGSQIPVPPLQPIIISQDQNVFSIDVNIISQEYFVNPPTAPTELIVFNNNANSYIYDMEVYVYDYYYTIPPAPY